MGCPHQCAATQWLMMLLKQENVIRVALQWTVINHSAYQQLFSKNQRTRREVRTGGSGVTEHPCLGSAMKGKLRKHLHKQVRSAAFTYRVFWADRLGSQANLRLLGRAHSWFPHKALGLLFCNVFGQPCMSTVSGTMSHVQHTMFTDFKDRWKEGTEQLRVLPIMIFLHTKLCYGERRHTVLSHFIKLKGRANVWC